MQADSSTPRKLRGRPFAKGFDSRRKIFTPEEQRHNFYCALAAIATRNPNATFYNIMDYFTGKRAAQKGATVNA